MLAILDAMLAIIDILPTVPGFVVINGLVYECQQGVRTLLRDKRIDLEVARISLAT